MRRTQAQTARGGKAAPRLPQQLMRRSKPPGWQSHTRTTREISGFGNFSSLDTVVETMNEKTISKEELRERLSAAQYEVTQNASTERAFTGEYWDTKDEGTYRCVVCDEALFVSDTKYDSGSGWPSFYEAVNADVVERRSDVSAGMARTEAVCSNCGAHLGHIFEDGPKPTGERFCMNSASLQLDRDPSSDA
jgi:peptide-methionine (R)-S-oxide reductase